MINRIKWALLLWLGILIGMVSAPFLLVFYVTKGMLLGVKATWRHVGNFMGQVKYDCLEGMRKKL